MAIIIERKLPERGDRGGFAAPAGQCCCCCCCCLHTVGSVAGALSARPVPLDPANPANIPVSAISADRPSLVPRYSATGLYWAICAILSGISIAYFFGLERDHVKREEVAVMMAMFFPGVQLAASLVALIAIVASRRLGKEIRLRHLGKITLRAFLGAMVGTLLMLPLLGTC